MVLATYLGQKDSLYVIISQKISQKSYVENSKSCYGIKADKVSNQTEGWFLKCMSRICPGYQSSGRLFGMLLVKRSNGLSL